MRESGQRAPIIFSFIASLHRALPSNSIPPITPVLTALHLFPGGRAEHSLGANCNLRRKSAWSQKGKRISAAQSVYELRKWQRQWTVCVFTIVLYEGPKNVFKDDVPSGWLDLWILTIRSGDFLVSELTEAVRQVLLGLARFDMADASELVFYCA
jgi:hypothetical protein